MKWYQVTDVPNPQVRVVVATTLDDGTALGFNYPLPQPPVPLSSAWSALLTTLAAVMVLSLLLVKILLKPLDRLARHAVALGKSIDTEPLEETGSTEIQAAARAMNVMQQGLLATEQQRRQVLSAISHDLKTPITRMLLRTEFMDEQDQLLTQKFVIDLHEMESMINESLSFIRTQTYQEAITPTDIVDLLAAVIAENSESGFSVSYAGVRDARGDPVQEAIVIPARKTLLRRCINNLISNGIKYGNSVSCSMQVTPDAVLMMFADQGRGVPVEQLEKVFEPFYRVDSSRNSRTGGHGLGLAICRQIADSHNGKVWLENNPAGGLLACLQLPRS